MISCVFVVPSNTESGQALQFCFTNEMWYEHMWQIMVLTLGGLAAYLVAVLKLSLNVKETRLFCLEVFKQEALEQNRPQGRDRPRQLAFLIISAEIPDM